MKEEATIEVRLTDTSQALINGISSLGIVAQLAIGLLIILGHAGILAVGVYFIGNAALTILAAVFATASSEREVKKQ